MISYTYENETPPVVQVFDFVISLSPAYNPITGTITMVFALRPEHGVNRSVIAWMKLTKGATAWSEPEVIDVEFDSDSDYRNLNTGYTSDGNLVIMYRKFPYSSYTEFDLCVRIYNEVADLWSDEYITNKSAILPANYNTHPALGNSAIVELSNGDLVSPFYAKNRDTLDKYICGIIVSTDKGVTWTEAYYTDETLIATRSIIEPSVLEIAPGVLLMVCRAGIGDYTRHIYQYISYNMGRTWEYQGQTTFDVAQDTTHDDHVRHWLPKLAMLRIYGKPVVACYYTNRDTDASYSTKDSKIRVIYALPEDLIGSNGHLGWRDNTLMDVYDLSDNQNGGNGFACHPNHSFKGIVCVENQNSNDDSDIIIQGNNDDREALALMLGVLQKSHLFGTGVPGFAPGMVPQFYTDTGNSKLYFSKGIASSADWVAAN